MSLGDTLLLYTPAEYKAGETHSQKFDASPEILGSVWVTEQRES